MNINQLRHPKEVLYRTLCLVFGLILWVPLIFVAIWFIPFVALFLWVASMFFKASLYGNAVKVSDNQFKELHKIKVDLSNQMNIKNDPEFFIFNAEGAMNALAVKFLSTKYILLFSSLIDLLDTEDKQQLKAILAHELAHHAAGHTDFWLNLAMKPAMFIPFLGAAYSRACEYTADRVAVYFVGDAVSNALLQLACGSSALSKKLSTDEFLTQETAVPSVAGFINEIYSSHPRMTRRIAEAAKYHNNASTSIATRQAA
ncbi:M48 family metallopeptidase [Pseudoalteromonas tunicata]|uniref:M48 family metallopeptidase n=1 Tax=Pseudoalteromonas tunicata TaxID=314281 RepID=UPI00273D0B73|nr:M48 family metallopeptidase [Pseudoalteromonas tunicata]MDP5211426.1 M48 family metallopeptidase [Pseudoalteromonas tunicata]